MAFHWFSSHNVSPSWLAGWLNEWERTCQPFILEPFTTIFILPSTIPEQNEMADSARFRHASYYPSKFDPAAGTAWHCLAGPITPEKQ